MSTFEGNTLVLGIGLREQAQAADIAILWQQAAHMLSLPDQAVFLVAVLQRKSSHPALVAFRQWLVSFSLSFNPVQLLTFDDAQLRGVVTPTQSAASLRRFGCGSVCEALALRSAPDWPAISHAQEPSLLLPRCISSNRLVTLAVAQYPVSRTLL